MNNLHTFVVRDVNNYDLTPMMFKLLVALVVLVGCSTVLIGSLLLLRSVRRSRQDESLPVYSKISSSRASSHSRHLTITTNTPASVRQEKRTTMTNSATSPTSPVPEIRITFPDEVDGSGKMMEGRVVVVTLGEHTVGMEPVNNEKLPPYQNNASERFQSLDLERMGGLKEKDLEKQWS